MKLFNKLSLFTLVLGAFSLFSCNDFENELGSKLDVSELDFTIIQDYSIDEGGNTIILTNNTPETIPVWDYGTGRSNRAIDTIHIAFAGDYTIKFSAITDGGVVNADPVTITVTDDNFNYIQDPMWETISGGVGNSKTWLLDLNEEGVSKYFNGPLYFYGSGDSWETIELMASGMGREDVNAQLGLDENTGWNWNPDWPGNQWVMDAADYGTMTFSLDGGPFLNVEHATIPILGSQSGTYYIDTEEHTLTTTDAVMLHDGGREGCVDDWADVRIFSLTEDTMQLGVLRRDDCDGAAMLVYNFISQEYSDNWVPVDEGPQEPVLPDGWEDAVSEISTTAITWKLDEETPINWAGLDGTLLNTWNSAADYPDWLGTPDASIFGDFSMTTDSSDGTVEFVTPDGTTTSGTYSLSDNGIYSFDIPVPTFPVINWANFYADGNNQLRILSIGTDLSGNIAHMWVGAVDDVNNPTQYSAFHLIPSSGGSGGDTGSEATAIPVDNSLINFGDLEGNGNIRIEIYNEYGSTGSNPPIDISTMNFNESVEVTFTISGTGVTGDYNASIYYADSDWYPSGNGSNTTVTGDGTYTVTFTPGAAGEGCIVFVVDIVGMGADIADLSTVNVTIDEVLIN